MRRLLSLALCTGALAAQRSFTGLTAGVRAPGLAGQLFVEEAQPARLQWRGHSADTVGGAAAVGLPFDVPGQAVELGAGSGFLVSGIDRTSGHGWLARVQLLKDPWRMELLESRDYGGYFDPYRVHWQSCDQLLWVFDFASERLLAAPWNGRELPELAAFKVAATSRAAPILGSASYLLGLSEAAGERGVYVRESAGFCATGLDPLENLVRPAADGFEVLVANRDVPGLRVPSLDVAERERINLGAPIRVRGGVGTARLRNVTSDAVAGVKSTTELLPTIWSDLPVPPEALMPGTQYRIAADSQPPLSGFEFLGLLRHGTPQATGQVVVHGGQLACMCSAGATGFSVRGWAQVGPKLRQRSAVTVDLWMGARGKDGRDPVAEVNGVHVLRELLAVVRTETITLEPVALPRLLQAPLPILADPRLVGNVLLWQWAVAGADGSVAVSDVFAATVALPIHAPDFDGTLARVRTMLPRVPEASLSALGEWLLTHPEWQPTGSAQQRWERALRGGR